MDQKANAGNTADETREGEEDEKVVGEATYKRFLSVIRANIGGVQSPMADLTAVNTIFCNYIGNSTKSRKAALKMGREKGHIAEWTDQNGRHRVALTTDGINEIVGNYPYSGDDFDDIDEIIQTEVASETPDKAVIGWANTQKKEIRQREKMDQKPATETNDTITQQDRQEA